MLKAISRLSVDCADFGEAAFLEVKFPFFGRFFAPLFSLAFFGAAFSDSVGLVSLSMNGNRPELWFFVYNKGVNAALKRQGDCFWPDSLYLIGMYRLFVPVKKTKQKDG